MSNRLGIDERYDCMKACPCWQRLQGLYSLVCCSISFVERHFLILRLWNRYADGCVLQQQKNGSSGMLKSTKGKSSAPDHNKKKLAKDALSRLNDFIAERQLFLGPFFFEH